MTAVIISPQAHEDIASIGGFIAQRNPDNANRFLRELREFCKSIGDFPLKWPEHPQFKPIRYTVFRKNYVIFYRVRLEAVEVVRIIHGAREVQVLD